MVIKTSHLQPCLYLYTKIDTFFAQEIDSWGIFSPCAKLFQRKFLNEHSIRFDSKTRFAEDIPFILQCISECNYIVIGSELDYYYINHSGTVSNSLYSFDSLYYSFSLCEQGIFKVIEKCKFSVQGSHNLFKTINFTCHHRRLRCDRRQRQPREGRSRLATCLHRRVHGRGCTRARVLTKQNAPTSNGRLVSRLGRPFCLLATGGVGFGPASKHPIQ